MSEWLTERRPTKPGENPFPGLLYLFCYGGPRDGKDYRQPPDGYVEGLEKAWKRGHKRDAVIHFCWLPDGEDAS